MTTSLLAATGTDLTTPIGLVVAIGALGYVLACMFGPNVPCGRCERGRVRSVFGGWRECRACGNTGYRRRLGRRLWEALHRD